jgi:5-(aminomethyl)-3-furanmethanol phosphate kinase
LSLTVVKVGGSYAHHPNLPALAAVLAEGAGRVIVVPGGGPFAARVRSEQQVVGYDDHAAHRMALLAMAQFGYALASFSATLSPASNLEAIRWALQRRLVPVWLVLDLLDGSPDLPETWDMTSDSLAAWLAGKLGAERVVFLKRANPAATAVPGLVADGIFDPLAPRFLASAQHTEAWLCGPEDIPRLGAALSTGDSIGRRIEVA